MPEHVHLLVSKPPEAKLADAIHALKLSFSKRAKTPNYGQVAALASRASYAWRESSSFACSVRLGSACPRKNSRLGDYRTGGLGGCGWATLAGKYSAGCPLTSTETSGGAPLLALFENWPAEPPTPFDSASKLWFASVR